MTQPVWSELNLAPAMCRISGGVVGSRVAFSLYVKYEDPDNPGTFLPFDFTGYTLLGYVKENVSQPNPDATLGLTAPGTRGAGYIDVLLTASETTALGKGKFYGSVKMWPTGDTDAALTIAELLLPLDKAATP